MVASKLGGWIPKRPKGPDCKSGGIAFAGSNPAPPMLIHSMDGSRGWMKQTSGISIHDVCPRGAAGSGSPVVQIGRASSRV